MSNDASSVLNTARKEIGYSRWTDPENGTKYGRWYEQTIDRTSGNYDFGANGVPYCAMFVSWVFSQAGASCAGIPGAYCPSVLAKGKSAGKIVSSSSAQAGDVVLFDWEGDGISDHVGIVEKNTGSYLQCIEGNTNNGCVARRTRSYSYVCGVIRPNYGTSAQQASTTISSTSTASSSTQIAVDGLWGKATTSALQDALGTPKDGIVSQQYAAYKASNPGLMASSWEWVQNPKSGGSDVICALQKKIGASVDGYGGPETFRKLQAYCGTGQDGVISRPSDVVKALQKKLNSSSL